MPIPDNIVVTPPTRLVTIEEAAERLSITPKQVQRLVNRGRLAAVRIGLDLRLSEAVIDEFVADAGRRHVFGVPQM